MPEIVSIKVFFLLEFSFKSSMAKTLPNIKRSPELSFHGNCYMKIKNDPSNNKIQFKESFNFSFVSSTFIKKEENLLKMHKNL